MSAAEQPPKTPPTRTRTVVAATCVTHPGTPGFCNLEVVKHGDDLILRPHATGACVVTMGDEQVRELHSFIGEILG